MIKKFLLLAIFFVLSSVSGYAASEIAVIVNITERMDSAQHKDTLEGFKSILTERGVSFTTTFYNLAGPKSGDEIISDIAGAGPDLVLPLGTSPTRLAVENITDLPVVFSMVLNPIEHGFVSSLDRPGGNVTGVSLNIPASEQFSLIKDAVSGIEKAGVIYDPSISGKVVESARAAAPGLGIELIEKPISEAGEISGALTSLRREGAELIWAIPDSTVYSGASVRQVLLFSLRNAVPVAGFSRSFAEAGALIGIYQDYRDIGRQTGEVAVKVIQGQDPGSIPVAFPRKQVFSLNQRVMDNFGLDVNSGLLEEAEHIFR